MGGGFSYSILNKYDADSFNKLKEDYDKKVNDPNFKRLYGDVKPFPETAYNTNVGRAAMVATMEEMVSRPITGEVTQEINRKRKADDDDARNKAAASFRESLIRSRPRISISNYPDGGGFDLLSEYDKDIEMVPYVEGGDGLIPKIGMKAFIPVNKIARGHYDIITTNGKVTPVYVGDKK